MVLDVNIDKVDGILWRFQTLWISNCSEQARRIVLSNRVLDGRQCDANGWRGHRGHTGLIDHEEALNELF